MNWAKDLVEQKEDLVKELISLGHEDGDWEHHDSDKTGLVVWRQKRDGFACSRGRCKIGVPAKIVFETLTQGKQGDFDDSYDGHVEIERFSQETLVNHVFTKPTWPVSARDFVVFSHIEGSTEPNQDIVILSMSCRHEKCESQQGKGDYVRGSLGLGGWIIRSHHDHRSCDLINIVQVNLGGKVPSWAVAKFVASQGAICGKVRDRIQKKVDKARIQQALQSPIILVPEKQKSLMKKQMPNCHKRSSASAAASLRKLVALSSPSSSRKSLKKNESSNGKLTSPSSGKSLQRKDSSIGPKTREAMRRSLRKRRSSAASLKQNKKEQEKQTPTTMLKRHSSSGYRQELGEKTKQLLQRKYSAQNVELDQVRRRRRMDMFRKPGFYDIHENDNEKPLIFI